MYYEIDMTFPNFQVDPIIIFNKLLFSERKEAYMRGKRSEARRLIKKMIQKKSLKLKALREIIESATIYVKRANAAVQ